METLIGKKLLHYRIEKLIGEGGMGVVYYGVHEEIDRKAAIKVINPELLTNPSIRERFLREARILAQLDHPNIVRLYEFIARDNLFLIMEYVDGIPLDKYIHTYLRGPIPLRQALEIFRQVLSAFSYAHKRGVIHRDIKPSNILLRSDGVPKVLDFGIARILDPQKGDPSLTRTGTTLGTMMYMSPEQLKAKSPEEIDHRSDIYSLGIVLYEMVTGKELYDRQKHSEFEILVKIASEPPPNPLEANPDLPAKLQPILLKAMAKSPNERYESCEAFMADIEKLLHNLPLDDGPPPAKTAELQTRNPLLRKVTATAAPSPQKQKYVSLYTLRETTWRALPRLSRVLIGVGILLVAGGGIYLMLSWFNPTPASVDPAPYLNPWIESWRKHDPVAMRKLLADTLVVAYGEKNITAEQLLSRYFVDFWRDIASDSLTIMGTPSAKALKDTIWITAEIRYKYITQPITRKVEKKYYDPLWGKYRSRFQTQTLPGKEICKIQKIQWRLYKSQQKIFYIEKLNDRNC
ncbi:MAG: serine/threonine protein kinase [Bacteroidia bacterium]